ncbi:MAG: hypothetical protein GY809_00040, partial [Planctomycetes bacterium]|nr:hypothetical protein [Planctomycetota bacterium]
KGRSSPQYFDSFELPVPVITDLFREAGEDKDLETLRRILKTGNDCQKYWAATWLGVNRDKKSTKALAQMATSDTPVLRVAALLALHRIEPITNILRV